MTRAQQEGAVRLKNHFSVRVINEARYMVECWQAAQQDTWSTDSAHNLQHAAARLQRYAERYDQQEHLQIAVQAGQVMQQVLKDYGRLTTATIETLNLLMQRLAEARLCFVQEQIEAGGPIHKRSKPLYLALADLQQAEHLAAQLAFYGMPTQVLRTVDELYDAFDQRHPLALIMDVDFAADGRGLVLVAHIQSKVDTPVPVVFFSATAADVMVRLAAVRMGGEAFLHDELDASDVLEVVEKAVATHGREPSRVLIVDDSRAQALLTERVLNSAVILTRVMHNPVLALKELDDFNPDLIILDMYMPECSGPELAKMIRQCDRFDSIPIIYQSAEEDLDKQLWAMRQGADDFLTKPVRPGALIATVRNRVARARSLKARMVRDSLTGLYNHTHIQKLLEESRERARRFARRLCVVMLDIDHFKQVNDTHGHPLGDRVIKSLAMLLKQRLRKSDLIGRYGGEEFVLILPDADAAQAVNLVDELRQRFQRMCFQSAAQSFSCSFSAGVAECVPDEERPAMDWIALADQALYQAKARGRNQVVLAGS